MPINFVETRPIEVLDREDKEWYTETFYPKEKCEDCQVEGTYRLDGDRNGLSICAKHLQEHPYPDQGWLEVRVQTKYLNATEMAVFLKTEEQKVIDEFKANAYKRQVAEDLWVCLNEQGLASEVMSEANMYPDNLGVDEDGIAYEFEEGDPLLFSQFSIDMQTKFYMYYNGLHGMVEKLHDEQYHSHCHDKELGEDALSIHEEGEED